jgi:formaldehyde-activating enzyme involved in methanogenesis
MKMKVLLESQIYPTNYEFNLRLGSVGIKATKETELTIGNIQIGIELIEKTTTPVIELEIEENKNIVVIDETFEIELDNNDKEEIVIRKYAFELKFKKIERV